MAVTLDELNQKLAEAKAAVDALVAQVQAGTDFQAQADAADAITAEASAAVSAPPTAG